MGRWIGAVAVNMVVASVLVVACSASVVDVGGGGDAAAGGGGEDGAGDTGNVVCPSVPPEPGSPCMHDMLTCDWGAGECVHQATCEDGAWSVFLVGDCAEPGGCPAEQPVGSCSDPGLTCTYGLADGCGVSLEVTCVDDTWTVTESPCDFTCPTDPEELPTPCEPCCHHRCFYDGPDFCDEWDGTCNEDGTWSVARPLC
jgi:hypothetical protein